MTLEDLCSSGATADKIAAAVLAGRIRLEPEVRRRDAQNQESQIAPARESTQRFGEVEDEFLARFEGCEADLASMRRLVPLTLWFSLFVVIYGAFPTLADEFNNSKLTGDMAAYAALERLFARFALGLGVSIFVYAAFSFFSGTLTRRRIHWKQLYGTAQKAFSTH